MVSGVKNGPKFPGNKTVCCVDKLYGGQVNIFVKGKRVPIAA